ncbi:hypothetical protein AAIR29_06415 [Psychrobacter sp. FBL11]|uniref:G domain-containing protein n=1 Tax=Psychrobacter saeujeotis TaxID=3143436 RepID=A0ABU9X782_9GAMM|nr:hypothetical protein [uncultured Psychrobacter sp.]
MNAEYLNLLESNLRQVMNIACDLDSCSKDTLSKIVETYRKIRLSRLLANEYFVAIGGTQGAGKTTLLSTIYNAEDWLTSNSGRGEQVPVFVYEKQGITEITASKIVFNTKTKKESEIECTKEEFKKTISQWECDSKDDERVVYVKLFVPIVFDIPFGWVLLPGYEVETHKNYAWQQLMRYVMTHALGVILVTSEERLAHVQTDITDDLAESLELRQPVIAISRSENYRDNEEKVSQLTERAREVFKVSDDRVIFTGTDLHNWKDNFEKAVIPLLDKNSAVENKKIHTLLEVINNDLSEVINDLEGLALNAEISDSSQNSLVNKLIDKFDKSANRYKQELSSELNRKTANLVTIAVNQAKKEYSDEEVGFINNTKIGIKRLTLNGTKVEDKRIERVRGKFTSEKIMGSNLRAINDTAQNKLNLKLSEHTSNNLLGYSDKKMDKYEESPKDYHESVNAGLSILLRKEEPSQSSSNKNQKEIIEKALEVLPAVAMEYSRIVQIAYLASTEDIDGFKNKLESRNLDTKDLQALMTNVIRDTDTTAEGVKTVMGIVGSLTGLDMVDGKLDGKINFSDSSSNSTDGLQTAALLATRVAGLAVAVGAVAFTAYQVSNSVNLTDKSNKNFIELYAQDLGRKNNAMVISEYDEHMQKISQYLRSNLEQMYGIGSTDTQHHLMVALKYLKNAHKDVRRVLNNEQINLV